MVLRISDPTLTDKESVKAYSHRHATRHVTDRTVLSCLSGGVNGALVSTFCGTGKLMG